MAIHFSQERITPQIAAEWLKNVHPNQRPIKRAVIEKYMRDLRSGTFMESHQAVAFDTLGRLIDGAHRSWAIVESGIPAFLSVARNVPVESVVVVDSGSVRTDAEAIGYIAPYLNATSTECAIARMIMKKTSKNVSRSEMLQFLRVHGDAVNFATDCTGPYHVITPILAVIAIACYTEDKAKLRRFITVLLSGLPGPGETPIILLRNWLQVHSMRGHIAREEAYWKTQRALWAYLKNVPMTKLTAATVEHFALPKSKEHRA